MPRPDAAYYRAWRQAHPGYGREWRRQYKATHPRKPEQRRSRAVVVDPIPELWSQDHPIIDRAWRVLTKQGFRRGTNGRALSFREDEMLLDAVGVAVLAILTRRSPDDAVRSFLAVERNWRVRAAPYLVGDFDDDED